MIEEKIFLKELFSFDGDKAQVQYLNELFTNLIKKSNKDSIYPQCSYFIDFLDFYSFCRPTQNYVSKELIACVCSYFPEIIIEIQQGIKENEDIIKFIIFPEEFPIGENKEQNEMFLLLQKDDIDGFISFLSKNPTIDITKEQWLEKGGYYAHLFYWNWFISLIDFCCLLPSIGNSSGNMMKLRICLFLIFC